MNFSEAGLHTVGDTCSDRTFVIPEFQRGYAWGKEQCKALWDDAINVMRRDHSQHFGGSIMVSRVEGSDKKVELVDGQQRLTSISLMLSALGEKGFPIEFRGNDALQTYFDHYALGHAHLAPSLKHFRSYYARNVAEAYEYFASQADALPQGEKEQLASTLLTRFKLFVLMIQPEFDIHVAFETINNRGKPLSTLEKLKNRLIYLASNADNPKDGREAAAEVHRCWKQVYAWLGAGRRMLDDDEFLRAHSMGWFRHERKADWLATQLFENEFSPHGDASPESIVAYVRSLDLAAACWHLVNEPELLVPTVARQLSALYKTPHATSQALLLWALMRLTKDHPKLLREPDIDTGWAEPLQRLACEAERFGVLVVLANNRVSTIGKSDISKSAYALAHPGTAIYKSLPKTVPPADAAGAVNFAGRHFASLVTNVDPSDDRDEEDEDEGYKDNLFPWEGHFDPTEVQKVIAGRLKGGNGFYNWTLGRLLIYAWEDRLRGQKGRPEKRSWDRFHWDESVEHIFPQNPVKGWKESISVNSKSPALATISNSLGNLLLLSKSLNSSASNEIFGGNGNTVGKRKRYENGSYSEIQVAHICTRWTVTHIAARGIAMLRHAQQTWNFELMEESEKPTAWLPLLFGDMAGRVQDGDFSDGVPLSNRSLNSLVDKFLEVR